VANGVTVSVPPGNSTGNSDDSCPTFSDSLSETPAEQWPPLERRSRLDLGVLRLLELRLLSISGCPDWVVDNDADASVSSGSSTGRSDEGAVTLSSMFNVPFAKWRPLNRRSRLLRPRELRLFATIPGLLNFVVGGVEVSVCGSTDCGGGSDAESFIVSEALVEWRPLKRRSRLDLGFLTRLRELRLFNSPVSLDSVVSTS
jgi:hypothetical protein